MTPEQHAQSMSTDPKWGFADNPVPAVAHASTRAAQADAEGRRDQAVWWTSVGIALVALAQPNEHVKVGEVLGQLALKYNVSLA